LRDGCPEPEYDEERKGDDGVSSWKTGELHCDCRLCLPAEENDERGWEVIVRGAVCFLISRSRGLGSSRVSV